MSDNEATLRVTSKAEISELVAYEKQIRSTNAAMREFMTTVAEADRQGSHPGTVVAGAAAGGQGANAGLPPPAPTPAVAQPGAAQGGAPPPPTAVPGAASAPWTPPSSSATFFGGASPVGSGGGGQPGGAANPLNPFTPGTYMNPAGYANKPPGMLSQGIGVASSFLTQTASTAIGVGLGTSLFGLPMAAINRYMTLSTVIEQVGQKFREASDNAELFGTSMGYGIARSAQLAETLGKSTNTFTRNNAVRMAGLARYSGADAGAVMSTLGTVTELTGGPLTNSALAATMNTAKRRNMDQGRFEEFLSRMQSTTQEQFAATGQATTGGVLGVMGLNSLVYGKDDPRNANDQSLTSGLQSVMTGSGAMRSYMMRAMGYGREGGPSYIDMRKRLDAGIHDASNLEDLFGSFQDRGMGTGAMFRAIESVSGGSLKANQIEALVNKLGTKEGLDEYSQMARATPGSDAMATFRASLSDKDRAAFDGANGGDGFFGGLGKTKISAGESYENRIEGRMMSVGGELAQGIPNLMDAMDALGRTMNNFFGGDVGGQLERFTGLLERVAVALEGGSQGPFRASAKGWGMAQDDYDQNGAASAAGHIGEAVVKSVEAVSPYIPYKAGGGVR